MSKTKITYTVRRPGCVAWEEGLPTLAAAERSAVHATMTVGMPHTIYYFDGTKDKPGVCKRVAKGKKPAPVHANGCCALWEVG